MVIKLHTHISYILYSLYNSQNKFLELCENYKCTRIYNKVLWRRLASIVSLQIFCLAKPTTSTPCYCFNFIAFSKVPLFHYFKTIISYSYLRVEMNKIVNKVGIYATSFRYIVQTTFSGEGNFEKPKNQSKIRKIVISVISVIIRNTHNVKRAQLGKRIHIFIAEIYQHSFILRCTFNLNQRKICLMLMFNVNYVIKEKFSYFLWT